MFLLLLFYHANFYLDLMALGAAYQERSGPSLDSKQEWSGDQDTIYHDERGSGKVMWIWGLLLQRMAALLGTWIWVMFSRRNRERGDRSYRTAGMRRP